jgi:Cyclin, N-terminal domain/Cyclin, C-terminal domain
MTFYGDVAFTESPGRMEEVVDVIAVMRHQEVAVYRRTDYLRLQEQQEQVQEDGTMATATAPAAMVVDATWRQRIVEWMFGVVDHCSLRRDSVAIAAIYLDLCVERGVIASRQQFQLAAMTALQLAIKLYDSTVVKLDSMIRLGRGLFTEQDVIDMEMTMIKALRWNLHPCTPLCFLRQYLRMLPPFVSPPARYVIAEVTRFISEISVCLYKFVDVPGSAIAYAGMIIAMDRMDEVALPDWQREIIAQRMSAVVGLDADSDVLQDIIQRLLVSLEKNVSIADLMDTIDAQCQAEGFCSTVASARSSRSIGRNISSGSSNSTASSLDSDDQFSTKKPRPAAAAADLAGSLHSPRDVLAPRQRRP